MRSVTGGNLVQISELFGRAIAAASRPDFLSRRLCPPLGEKRRRGEWLPLAPVARQGFVAGFRAFRAPLQPDGLAVWGQGRGENKPTARWPSSCAQTRGVDMTRHDPEIEELLDKVHCAVVLEQTPPCWKLDRKESTKRSLKYRRGRDPHRQPCWAGLVGSN